MLAEEITAKKLKLNEAREQISDISFAEEPPKCVDSSTQTEEFNYLVAGVPPLQFTICNCSVRHRKNSSPLSTELGTFRINFWLLSRVIAL